MAYSKIITDFSYKRYSDQKLSEKAHSIVDYMTNNPHFPDPSPTILELNGKIEAFDLAKWNAKDGGIQFTYEKNIARVELEIELRQIAWYVQNESEGKTDILLGSGFDLQKEHASIGPLKPPTGLKLIYGEQSGEVILKCDVLPNARAYCFDYTEAPFTPESHWNSKSSTKRQIELSGLKAGVEYYFRIAGIGTDPSRNWSEVLVKMVV